MITVNAPSAVQVLATMLLGARGGRSEIMLRVTLSNDGEATVRIGRDFLIDGELANALASVAGVVDVSLDAADPPRLALAS